MRKTLFVLILLLSFTTLFAQRERNYVYILDCTQSMRGYNGSPNIWNSTLDYLYKDINGLPPSTSVSIIPFQTQVHQPVEFTRQDFSAKKWEQIKSTFESYLDGPLSNTNICDAWTASTHYINPNKDNYIILLTDGEDNVKKVPALVRLLDSWCGKYKNTEGFYVKLTPFPINATLKNAIENCGHLTLIEMGARPIPFGKFLSTHLNVNTLELPKKFKIPFSTMGSYQAEVVDNASPLDIKIENGKIDNGYITLSINSNYSTIQELNEVLGDQLVRSTFSIKVDPNQLNLLDNVFDITIVNKEERVLYLENAMENQATLDKASYYPAWLFSSASKIDTIRYDLGASFSKQAKSDGSAVTFRVVDDADRKDYSVLFNGELLSQRTFNIDRRTNQAVLSFVFNQDAKEGTRYIKIQAVNTHELDRINDDSPSEFDFSLKASYQRTWNPLKVAVTWIVILLLAALILWFLFFKHALYPTVKVGTITITDPYFSSVRVKGARKVVFTNRKQSQSMLSQIFTGRIIYQVHEVWASPFILEPVKKGFHPRTGGQYVVDPYTARLEKMSDYTIIHNQTGNAIKIRIN